MNILNILRRGNEATLHHGDKATPLCDDLDELMRSSEQYGRMALSRMNSGGWWARIEMNTIATGSSFKIESDYSNENPQTPLQAVQQCMERAHTALKALGVQP